MDESKFAMNYEIFYNSEDEKVQELADIKSLMDSSFYKEHFKVKRVFDFSDVDNILSYEHYKDDYAKRNVSVDFNLYNEVNKDDYKKAYRKFFQTRLFSTMVTCDEHDYGDYRISASIDFIRGPYTVVLVYINVKGIDTPDKQTLANITSYIQDRLPLSVNGKISPITPAKLTLMRSNYVVPTKKCLARFTHLKYSKKISQLVTPETAFLFEYKWVKLKTGIIMVWERYDELINPLTGNKIDPMYIEKSWPAFDTDLLMSILDKPLEFEFVKGINISDQIAEEVWFQLQINNLKKNVLNDRIVSYFRQRISFVESFEKSRNAKRALQNMGKDVLDTLSQDKQI